MLLCFHCMLGMADSSLSNECYGCCRWLSEWLIHHHSSNTVRAFSFLCMKVLLITYYLTLLSLVTNCQFVPALKFHLIKPILHPGRRPFLNTEKPFNPTMISRSHYWTICVQTLFFHIFVLFVSEINFWNNRLDNLQYIYEQLRDERVRKMAVVLEKTDSAYFPCFKTLFRNIVAGK